MRPPGTRAPGQVQVLAEGWATPLDGFMTEKQSAEAFRGKFRSAMYVPRGQKCDLHPMY